MNKPVFWFSFSSHPDERVRQMQTKIFAQAGLFSLFLALSDMVVRGLILNRPAVEWGGSLIIFVGFLLFYGIRTIFAGLYDPNLEDEGNTTRKIKISFFESIVMAIGISVGSQVPYGIPANSTDWFKFFLKFILILAVYFTYKYIAIKISLKRANKDLELKE